MYRRIMEELIKWKKCKERKPLILRGARQVGKTYIIKQFGEENYDGVAYFNFDHDTQLQNMFETTKDPKSILEQLSFVYGKAILPEKTLIVFDEIQECPNALNSLKYFEEEAKEYHIVSAGSLLGIRLSHTSFPVGKVDFLNMYPMTFTEFLEADGQKNLVNYMDSIKKIENIPDIFFNKLSEKLKAYFIIGGMPYPPVYRNHRGQHPLRPPGCFRGGGEGGCQAGQRRFLYPAAAERLRYYGDGGRRKSLPGPEAAVSHCQSNGGRSAGSDPGRGHQLH